LKGKTFILSTTTGGPEESYQTSGYNKYTMKEFLLPILKLGDSLEMNVLDPIVLHSAMFQDEVGKQALENNKYSLTDGTILKSVNQSNY